MSTVDYWILSIFHYLGCPSSYCTLIFYLMRNLYIYNACIYSFYFNHWGGWLCCVGRLVPEAIHNQVAI